MKKFKHLVHKCAYAYLHLCGDEKFWVYECCSVRWKKVTCKKCLEQRKK